MGSLLFIGGKLALKGGKLVFVDSPADCDCCGSPPWTSCDGCATTPTSITAVITGATNTAGISCDDWNGTYTLPRCPDTPCSYWLIIPAPPGWVGATAPPFINDWALRIDIQMVAGSVYLTVFLFVAYQSGICSGPVGQYTQFGPLPGQVAGCTTFVNETAIYNAGGSSGGSPCQADVISISLSCTANP